MDITTLAAWGEFLGGIAVVVSLIYLASQIRQNSKLLQISSSVAIATSESCTTWPAKSAFVAMVADAVEARISREFCRICEAK